MKSPFSVWYKPYVNLGLTEIAKFLRLLHDTTMTDDNQVYVHGDINYDSFYFTNDELTDVVNWDKAKLGDIYEDMISLLINYSGMNERYRDNLQVVEIIRQIFDAYNASDDYKKNCMLKLSGHIEDAIREFSMKEIEKDNRIIYTYESYLWCKSFVDVFINEI